MEGSGHETTRGPERAGPSFEPPVDPAGGASLDGLSLVARITRARELAGAAAGFPPLDSDQVLDLQRTAGNLLTAGALSRWLAPPATQPLTPEQARRLPAGELLERLLPARAGDPATHAAIAAALDTLDPPLRVRLSCTAGATDRLALAVHGPAGGAGRTLGPLVTGESTSVELPFSATFGSAREAGPDHALTIALTAPDGTRATAELALPFTAPCALALANGARLVAFAEAG
jgi:hypothetical protein